MSTFGEFSRRIREKQQQSIARNMQQYEANRHCDILHWIRDDHPTPFQAHIGALRLAKIVLSNDSAIPNIIWDSDNRFEGMTCNGVHVSIAKLRHLVGEMFNLANGIMKEDLCFGYDTPSLLDRTYPFETKFADKMQSNQLGYSFHNDLSNPSLTSEEHRSFVLDKIFHDPILRNKFLDYNENLNPVALGSWLKRASQFVKILGLLIHMTSGQCSRMTELVEATTICNTPEGGTRSLYWVHNTIMLVQSYNKSKSKTGVEMLIARFVPSFLLPLFLDYLVFIRPFEQMCVEFAFPDLDADKLHAMRANYRDLLFVANGKLLTTAQMTNALGSLSFRFINGRLSTQMYRQISVALMWMWIQHFEGSKTTHLTDEEDKELSDLAQARRERMESDMLFNEQSAHTAEMGNNFYGFTTSDFRYLNRDALHNFWLVSKEWAVLLNLPFCRLDVPTRSRAIKRINVNNHSNARSADLVQFNSQPVDHPCIAADASSSLTLVQNFATECNVVVNAPNVNQLVSAPISNALLHALRQFMRNDLAKFSCPEQANAINAALNLQKDALFCLPTGCGKTLSFLLPAFIMKHLPGKKMMTIVFVPLVALTFDLMSRCREAGITYTTWNGTEDNTNSNADILFLSIEQAMNLKLCSFLDKKYHNNEIASIFVDEAHLIVSWSSFRPHFNNLVAFRRYHTVPWRLLSATVPHYLEQELSKMFGSLHVVRKSSNRPNLAFKVQVLEDDQSIDNQVLTYVKDECIPYGFPTIIYVRTIAQVPALVDALNKSNGPNTAVGYHGKMETQDRQNNQRAFMDDLSNVMVATSSFGMGVDKNNVRCVINCGASYSGLESLQMLGRGGRDGQKSLALTFTTKDDMEQILTYDSKYKDNDLQHAIAYDQVKRYVQVLTNTKDCRRHGFNSLVDPAPESCNSEIDKNEPCDICLLDSYRTPLITDAITATSSYYDDPQTLESLRFTNSVSVSLLNKTIRMNIASMSFEQLILVLQKFNEDLPQDACAVCFFQRKLDQEEPSLVVHANGVCRQMFRACYACLQEDDHSASTCEFKLNVGRIADKFKSAGDICFKCLMYTERVELHGACSVSNCTLYYLQRRYATSAWWFFRNRHKSSLAVNFIIDAPTTPSEFFSWLYSRNSANGMYNHLALVAMLYKFFDNQPC